MTIQRNDDSAIDKISSRFSHTDNYYSHGVFLLPLAGLDFWFKGKALNYVNGEAIPLLPQCRFEFFVDLI